MPDPATVLVEGEPWTGLVAVRDAGVEEGKPGHYALIRATEWCTHPDEMTVWRGPRKPDETVPRERLSEVSCRTVLVDKRGFYVCMPLEGERTFYPCPDITEELVEAVGKEAEGLLDAAAEEWAAEAWSDVGERLVEDFGEDVWVTATFGDAVAVNGEIVLVGKKVKPPRGWVETDRGGRIPDGGEAEIEKESLIGPISSVLTEKLKTRIDPWTVGQILNRMVDPSFERDYITWGAGSGDSEIWVPKRALKEYEARVEKEEEVKREREIREAMERRRQEEEERRAKIRKGGYPTPKEWSPRGRLPGEE